MCIRDSPESELDLDRLMDELSEDEIVRRKETEFTPCLLYTSRCV